MLGISVYFQDLDLEYIEEVAKIGVKNIFTSVQVIEEDYSDFDEKMEKLLKVIEKYEMTLIPDISPSACEKLKIDNIYELKDKGFKAIRVDGGFEKVQEIKELVEKFLVYLNASDVKPEFLNELRESGCDMERICVMHNFYPRYYTGLNKEHMISINKGFKKQGVKIAAFVQGDLKLRGPVFEGLPTLEKHRGVNPYVAGVELLNSYVDHVYIGDNKGTLESLKKLKCYMEEKILTVKVHLNDEYKNLEKLESPIRGDILDHIIRLRYGRGDIKENKVLNPVKRYKGAITMDNTLSGRYEGEINICKENLQSDGKINIIGHINPEYLDVLDYVKRDSIIRFSN
ncbi:MAG: MupG family TIM beta-alpha barrel fold protein [Clostridium sp.]|uniref:MupG family TIM beta-alpha barrel fold protein n=1 Tax=Clostridium sp. TaxID=1506 RepID=UPI003F345A1B